MKLKRVTTILLAAAVSASVLLSGCGGINEKAVLATVDEKTEIPLGFANFVAHYNQVNYDSLYVSYYGDTFWHDTSLTQDESTLEDTVKADILDTIEMYYLLEAHMSDYGVEITEEDQAAMKKAAEQFMADNSKEAIRELGATQEYVEKLLYYRTLQQKMEDAIKAEVDTNVDDKEAAQKTFSYIRIDLKGHTDEEGNYTEYTEEEAANVKQAAINVATVAKKDFEKAAKDADCEISTKSYGEDDVVAKDDDAYDPSIAAAEKLKEGEVSDLIEGTDCYYIVRMDSEFDKEATEKKKQSIVSERQSEHYTEVTEGYKKDAKIDVNEKMWEKVKFDNLFTLKQESQDTDSTEE